MIVGIGTDIVEISRIEKATKKWGKKFLNRVFVESEIYYCYQRKNPFQHLAGKFAAKEALIKALNYFYKQEIIQKVEILEGDLKDIKNQKDRGVNLFISLKEIEIDNDEQGMPIVTFNSPHLNAKNLSLSFHLSIAHERNYAIAFAIIEKEAVKSF